MNQITSNERHYDLSGKFIIPAPSDIPEIDARADAGDNSARYLSGMLHLGCFNSGAAWIPDLTRDHMRAGTESEDAFCSLRHAIFLINGQDSIGTHEENTIKARALLKRFFPDILRFAKNDSAYAKTMAAEIYLLVDIDTILKPKTGFETDEIAKALNNLVSDKSPEASALYRSLFLYMKTELPRRWDRKNVSALTTKLSKEKIPLTQQILRQSYEYVGKISRERANAASLERAMANLRAASALGDFSADYILYLLHKNNTDHKNIPRAFDHLIRSARGGFVYAQTAAGLIIQDPELMPELEKACRAGMFPDLVPVIDEVITLNSGDWRKYWYMEAARQDFSAGHYGMAQILQLGERVPPNYAEVLICLFKAAKQNHNSALMDYADFYFTGRDGVPINFAEAFRVYDYLEITPAQKLYEKLGQAQQELVRNRMNFMLKHAWAEDAIESPDRLPDDDGMWLVIPHDPEAEGISPGSAILIFRDDWARVADRMKAAQQPIASPQ